MYILDFEDDPDFRCCSKKIFLVSKIFFSLESVILAAVIRFKIEDTHREKAPSKKSLALRKSTNMGV